jgi:hypothetical protein
MKVGVMIPTYQRPDLLRAAVLQWIVQTRPPDIICVHQNGEGESYEWVVEDLRSLVHVKWVYMPKTIPQHRWYLVPLSYLIAQDCDVFFWGDHDDIYLRNHVEKCIRELVHADITVSETCGVLYLKGKEFAYDKPRKFTAHAPGGMSSSMAFNRPFALALEEDLQDDTNTFFSDNVVANVTMPKFRVFRGERNTTVYVSHSGSYSSSSWVKESDWAKEANWGTV